MTANPCAARATFRGDAVPNMWKVPFSRSYFGDLALFAFLLVQGLDGFYTYLGVATYGVHIEANPIVSTLMTHLGYAPGLLSAKAIAGLLGICLYFCQVHSIVAVLTGVYITAAIAPWTLILFY